MAQLWRTVSCRWKLCTASLLAFHSLHSLVSSAHVSLHVVFFFGEVIFRKLCLMLHATADFKRKSQQNTGNLDSNKDSFFASSLLVH